MTDTKPRRDLLEDYEDVRVKAEGYFEKTNITYANGKENKVALVQEVYVFVDGKELPVGHVWVQSAASIWAERPQRGDRVKFTARVHRYTKNLATPNPDTGLMTELRYGLTNPEDAEVVARVAEDDRPYSGHVDPIVVRFPDPQPSPVDVFAAMADVKAFVRAADGVDLSALLPHLPSIVTLSGKAGGPEQLAKMIDFLI